MYISYVQALMDTKRPIIILLILLSQINFGQIQTIEIGGKVSFYNDKSQKIFDCKAKLLLNDTLFFETHSDTNGNYVFTISENLIKNFKAFVYVYQDQNFDNTKYRSLECPYLYFGPERFISPERSKIIYSPGVKKYVINFYVNEACYSPHLPFFSFKKNSEELINFENFHPDTTILCLKALLLNNPTMVIQLRGNAWEEKNMKLLSIRRANLIKNRLINFGIDSLRILTTGLSDKVPYFSKSKIFDSNLSKNEIEDRINRNRRVDYKVLSFDFDSRLKKRVETKEQPKTNSQLDDEDD